MSKTTTAVLAGTEDVSTWSDAQLIRGTRQLHGRKPKVVPVQVVHELTRRRFFRANQLLQESLEDATKMLASIATDKRAPYMARLRAIEIIYDRILGKPPEYVKLDIDLDAPWQKLIKSAVIVPAQDDADIEQGIIEGEILDDTQPLED